MQLRCVANISLDDVASTTAQIVSALHRRFPESFTPSLVSDLAAALAPPSREYLSSLSPEQREKEDAARISRQRPILRLCSELALVGIIRDAPNRSGGEWIMKTIKGLVSSEGYFLPSAHHILQLSNDPTLSSLPLFSTFLKAYSRPFLGISTSSSVSKQQASADAAPGDLSSTTQASADFPTLARDADELVEQDIRDRFRRMCEGYFESVSKKLLIEHKVRLRTTCTRPILTPFLFLPASARPGPP